MTFVYLHIIWFGCWIGFGVERYPYGLLTMIVSLEAIFLSTFVMISQNRADAKREVIADQQWKTVQEEDQQNRQLLELSEQILDLTKAVHAYASRARAARPPGRPCATVRNARDRHPSPGARARRARRSRRRGRARRSRSSRPRRPPPSGCSSRPASRPPGSRRITMIAARMLRACSRSGGRIGPLIPSRRRALAQFRRELDRLPETPHPRDGDTASRG